MKQICLLFLLFAASLVPMRAQTDAPQSDARPEAVDSLATPPAMRPLTSTLWPSAWWGSTPLHTGLNVGVGLGVGAAFGKNAPSGAGFMQNLSLHYVRPLSRRFDLSLGLYGQNQSWGSYTDRTVGVSAMVRYQATERLNLYAYGARTLVAARSAERMFPANSLLHNHFAGPFSPFFRTPDTLLGAAAQFKIGEKAAITLSFDWQQYDRPW